MVDEESESDSDGGITMIHLGSTSFLNRYDYNHRRAALIMTLKECMNLTSNHTFLYSDSDDDDDDDDPCPTNDQDQQQKLEKIRTIREKEVFEETERKKRVDVMKKRRDAKKKKREEKNLLKPGLDENEKKKKPKPKKKKKPNRKEEEEAVAAIETADVDLNKMMQNFTLYDKDHAWKQDLTLINENELKDKLCLNAEQLVEKEKTKEIAEKILKKDEKKQKKKQERKKLLAHCGNKNCNEKASHRCAKCKSIAYCSIYCARLDQYNHKIECVNKHSARSLLMCQSEPEVLDLLPPQPAVDLATSPFILLKDKKTREVNLKENETEPKSKKKKRGACQTKKKEKIISNKEADVDVIASSDPMDEVD